MRISIALLNYTSGDETRDLCCKRTDGSRRNVNIVFSLQISRCQFASPRTAVHALSEYLSRSSRIAQAVSSDVTTFSPQ